MLFASMLAFRDDDGRFLHHATANELESEWLANRCAVELRMNIFEPRDGMPCERDDDVADDDAGFVSGTVGFDFEDDSRGLFVALQGLTKRIGQTHRLKSDAQVA